MDTLDTLVYWVQDGDPDALAGLPETSDAYWRAVFAHWPAGARGAVVGHWVGGLHWVFAWDRPHGSAAFFSYHGVARAALRWDGDDWAWSVHNGAHQGGRADTYAAAVCAVIAALAAAGADHIADGADAYR